MTPKGLLILLEKLEELDDVQNVFANFNINETLNGKINLIRSKNLIIGFDPGLINTGWGVLQKNDNKKTILTTVVYLLQKTIS